MLNFAYCLDRESFVSAFDKIGIKITSEADIPALVTIHEQRLDVDGKLGVNNSNGEPLKIDLREFINYNIPFRSSQFAKCRIKYIP